MEGRWPGERVVWLWDLHMKRAGKLCHPRLRQAELFANSRGRFSFLQRVSDMAVPQNLRVDGLAKGLFRSSVNNLSNAFCRDAASLPGEKEKLARLIVKALLCDVEPQLLAQFW